MTGWDWGALVGGLIAVVGGADMACVLTGRRTLSSYVIAESKLYPLIPFATGCAVGALAVHFWAALICANPQTVERTER